MKLAAFAVYFFRSIMVVCGLGLLWSCSDIAWEVAHRYGGNALLVFWYGFFYIIAYVGKKMAVGVMREFEIRETVKAAMREDQ